MRASVISMLKIIRPPFFVYNPDNQIRENSSLALFSLSLSVMRHIITLLLPNVLRSSWSNISSSILPPSLFSLFFWVGKYVATYQNPLLQSFCLPFDVSLRDADVFKESQKEIIQKLVSFLTVKTCKLG